MRGERWKDVGKVDAMLLQRVKESLNYVLFVMQALKTYHGAPQYGVVSLPERPGALPPGRQVLPV